MDRLKGEVEVDKRQQSRAVGFENGVMIDGQHRVLSNFVMNPSKVVHLELCRAGVSQGIEQITPGLAKFYLGFNTKNRKLREARSKDHAREMLAGGWVPENPDPIMFGLDGTLVNGQHRLRAVVIADQPQRMLVLRGVGNQVLDSLDTGRARTFKDTLRMEGYPNYQELASILKRVWILEEIGSPIHRAHVSPSVRELRALLGRDEDYFTSLASFAARWKKSAVGIVLSAPDAGVLKNAFLSVAPAQDVEAFFNGLGHGSGDKVIQLLRRRLVVAGKENRPGPEARVALTIKGWNLWIRGQEREFIRWTPGGANPEPFPVAIGPDL